MMLVWRVSKSYLKEWRDLLMSRYEVFSESLCLSLSSENIFYRLIYESLEEVEEEFSEEDSDSASDEVSDKAEELGD
jgi:hypothetical protein